MKAPNKELRKYVYDRLYNSIIVGTAIPVCSVPAKNQTFPFIDLGNIGLTDESTKDKPVTLANFEINVYTQFADENTNYTQCEEITNAVFERLINFRGDTENFYIRWCRLVSSQESYEQTETVKAISNQIIFEFFIEQF